MKKVLLNGIGIFIILLLAFPVTGMAKKTKLRLQCVYPERAYMGQTTLFFAERVKALTDGNVTVKVFWPGQLVKTKEAFDAMSKEMIDGYSGSLQYFSGYVPEVNCEWLPFGWADPGEVRDVYQNYGWLELMREALAKHGVRYVAPLCCGSMGLITQVPVHGVADLKGRKIRAVGMEAKVMDVLGAAPVSISGAEQYMALKRGTVEGTDYPFYTIDNYKFYEVCNTIVRPALHTPGVIEILFNQKVYESLPPDYRQAVDQAGWEAFLRTVELNPQWDQKAYEICREKNINIIDLTPEAVQEFRSATAPLWNEIAAKSDVSARLVDNLKTFLEKKGIIVN